MTSSGATGASPTISIVYQLGNSASHDFMWAYLFRYPGLLVLHDAQVHQARALWLLQRARAAPGRTISRNSRPITLTLHRISATCSPPVSAASSFACGRSLSLVIRASRS